MLIQKLPEAVCYTCLDILLHCSTFLCSTKTSRISFPHPWNPFLSNHVFETNFGAGSRDTSYGFVVASPIPSRMGSRTLRILFYSCTVAWCKATQECGRFSLKTFLLYPDWTQARGSRSLSRPVKSRIHLSAMAGHTFMMHSPMLCHPPAPCQVHLSSAPPRLSHRPLMP